MIFGIYKKIMILTQTMYFLAIPTNIPQRLKTGLYIYIYIYIYIYTQTHIYIYVYIELKLIYKKQIDSFQKTEAAGLT